MSVLNKQVFEQTSILNEGSNFEYTCIFYEEVFEQMIVLNDQQFT